MSPVRNVLHNSCGAIVIQWFTIWSTRSIGQLRLRHLFLQSHVWTTEAWVVATLRGIGVFSWVLVKDNLHSLRRPLNCQRMHSLNEPPGSWLLNRYPNVRPYFTDDCKKMYSCLFRCQDISSAIPRSYWATPRLSGLTSFMPRIALLSLEGWTATSIFIDP